MVDTSLFYERDDVGVGICTNYERRLISPRLLVPLVVTEVRTLLFFIHFIAVNRGGCGTLGAVVLWGLLRKGATSAGWGRCLRMLKSKDVGCDWI